jgi:hypothetical protein
MSGHHASTDDIHGYIALGRLLVRFSLFCGSLVMVTAISLLLLRIGAAS